MATAPRPRTATFRRLAGRRTNRLVVWVNALCLTGALAVVLSVPPAAASMRLGDTAGQTVVARHQVTFADRAMTALRRRAVMNQTPIVYEVDLRRPAQLAAEAATFLQGVSALMAGGAPAASRPAAIRRLLPAGVPSRTFQQFYTLDSSSFGLVRQHSQMLLNQAEAWHFTADQVQSTALALLSTIPPQVSLRQRTAIGEVLAAFLAPTEIPDLGATIARRRAAARTVGTVYTTLHPGQVIIHRGDVVTASTLQALAALGVAGRTTDWHDVAATLLIVSVVIGMLLWYLYSFQPAILDNVRLLLLVDIALLGAVLATRLLTPGHVLLPFFLPIAAISTFAAVLLAPEACIALTLAIAILAGWIVADSFELTVYYLFTGAAGVLAIHRVRQIKQFIVAGLCIALFALAVALAFGLVQHTYDFAALQDYVLAAAFNGFLSSTLALGGFALLSGFFGVTTVLQLFELSQPNQPLLRRLTSKAPGTYNHSLVVATMVEQAAEAIGANSLVAKVAALYHDVGKTANPYCFAENQLGISNIHDELRPDESARIIRGHVLQGLRLARQHRLPRVVVDGIAEHHGTMPLTFFLHKAEHTALDEPIDLALYRYPGPRPQSKETALLMLADGCESAVRAAHDHSHEQILDTVRMIFRERIQGGQLDESPLTMRDLDRAQSSFCSVLNGLYHPRIEYPDLLERHHATRFRATVPGTRADGP